MTLESKREETEANPQVKGVKGMNSREKTRENGSHGYLTPQKRHFNLPWWHWFDMVDITTTHFKPKEIGIMVQQARDLGYECDDENQVLELKPQDVVIPMNCTEKLVNTTKYVDDLLITLYGMNGFTIVNLSRFGRSFNHGNRPHTSGAILSRIIGFCDERALYPPYFHAAKRWNCDGDIDAILLLLDGLLNFSRSFLSANRGGMMDAPLILTTTIIPTEIDKEALNVDTMSQYPIFMKALWSDQLRKRLQRVLEWKRWKRG